MENKRFEAIKEAFEEWCAGDNNGESFLGAQFSDWVIVKLDFSTATYSEDERYAFVEGIIPYLKVFQNESGTWVSEWGDAHEFDPADIQKDEFQDEWYLENVRGEWTFSIEVKENEYTWNGYEITFQETDAIEIREMTDAEKLADMMNQNPNIPETAIYEFEKDPKGTIKKYEK